RTGYMWIERFRERAWRASHAALIALFSEPWAEAVMRLLELRGTHPRSGPKLRGGSSQASRRMDALRPCGGWQGSRTTPPARRPCGPSPSGPILLGLALAFDPGAYAARGGRLTWSLLAGLPG